LLAQSDRPIDLAEADGIGRVARYAFDGRAAAFFDHFADVYTDGVRFTVERYEAFQKLLDRFTVAFGIDDQDASRLQLDHGVTVIVARKVGTDRRGDYPVLDSNPQAWQYSSIERVEP
jgi:hypothetical protein